MTDTFTLLGAFMLFLVGLRLSGFFSGVESGFYRVSFLRLNIDSQAGDSIATRLLRFLQNPSSFVATCLVGNNVANYITTLAVGLFVSPLVGGGSGWGEVLATLAVAPVVFIGGELLPKNLYLRAPLRLLRRDAKLFNFFYHVFRPVSFPLIGIAKLFEHFSRNGERTAGTALGRNRLAQVLSQGHREGILMDVQNRMITGLMAIVQDQVTTSMTPAVRIIGVEDSASREEILEAARRYGVPHIIVRRAGEPDSWYGYVRTADVLLSRGSVAALIEEMPRFSPELNRLEALLTLRETGQKIGLVVDADGHVLGVVYEQGLIDALLRG